jgi:trehalose 6-phosphate phosphatase
MNILNSDITLHGYFDRLRQAPRRLLMLDYDGTLAPFTTVRYEARPYPELLPLLETLFAHPTCRTVLISGRSVDELYGLLHFTSIPEIWGSHGWERLLPDGSYIPPAVPPDAARTLGEEWEWLTAMFPARQAERKPASVALHWRGLDSESQLVMQALTRKRWRRLRDSSPLEVHPFDGGVELRARGRNKGDVIRSLLDEYPSPPVCAYLGDDRTDEEAFAALAGRGLRVLVRSEPRETLADLQLAPPDDLLWFLEQWRAHL